MTRNKTYIVFLSNFNLIRMPGNCRKQTYHSKQPAGKVPDYAKYTLILKHLPTAL